MILVLLVRALGGSRRQATMGWDSLSTMDGEGPWARSLWVLREGERERKKACTDERVQQEYQEQN